MSKRYAMLQALLAAALFGLSAPLSQVLLSDIEPILLAAFLYLGSGLSAWLLLLATGAWRGRRGEAQGEAGIRRADWPWLAGALVVGGVAAPIVLMFSLQATPASTASLLLNFEGIATTLIAAWVFGEQVGRRVWLAVALVSLSGVLLSWADAGNEWGVSLGALGVLGACFLWGVDNNLTRQISAKNPLSIVAIKGIGAGACSLLLGVVAGNALPSLRSIVYAMLVGGLCYGVSIVLFILALRGLGAARTSALFGAAPFIGALLSLVIFGETPDLFFVAAFLLMVVGAFFLLGEAHAHRHRHLRAFHEHRHRHDDAHHEHAHAPGGTPARGYHSHWHRHEPFEHAHQHAPDIHHRHAH